MILIVYIFLNYNIKNLSYRKDKTCLYTIYDLVFFINVPIFCTKN